MIKIFREADNVDLRDRTIEDTSNLKIVVMAWKKEAQYLTGQDSPFGPSHSFI